MRRGWAGRASQVKEPDLNRRRRSGIAEAIGEETRMTDHATPNLPSRDLEAPLRFYGALGVSVSWRDEGWMILERDGLTLEFFQRPQLGRASGRERGCRSV